MSQEETVNDDIKYIRWQEGQALKWEALCTRCGACCGIFEGDPCENLMETANGRYACRIYQNRFGTHKTKNGRVIKCVPIRDILHKSWPGDRCCGYKNR